MNGAVAPGAVATVRASAWVRAGLLALLAVIAMFARTPMPVDETRYLAVAWEMWQRGDFLVPYLNGATYSHKPPLLFWTIHAGWLVFGVNDVWPRLVLPACALATTLVTARIARTLWPDAPWLGERAAWILLGSLLFALFGVMLMFDVLMALCVSVGVLGLARAVKGRSDGFVLFAIGIGSGVLAKGPAVLLHLVPAALLAPWWAGRAAAPWWRWYGRIALAVAGGAAIALAWAIPAGWRGGENYREAIFWGQTAYRMVESFAHRQPMWWYVPWLPLILAPFVLWRPLWQGLRAPGLVADRGVRLALAVMLPALLAFSLISGKQFHYLMPELPAFALLAARAIEQRQPARRPWLAAIALAAIGATAAALPHLELGGPVAALREVSAAGALVFLALAAWLARVPRLAADQVPRLAAAVVLALAAAHLLFVPRLAPAWDMRPLAQAIGELQAAGRPVAHAGKYHGQYQFAGRLPAPLQEVDGPDAAVRWAAAHPDGAVVVYFRNPQALADFRTLAAQPFRGRHAALVEAGDVERAFRATTRDPANGAAD
jgi:4-amino-4-deoxy-L-arabinose transferase-like glycosyltransferase